MRRKRWIHYRAGRIRWRWSSRCNNRSNSLEHRIITFIHNTRMNESKIVNVVKELDVYDVKSGNSKNEN